MFILPQVDFFVRVCTNSEQMYSSHANISIKPYDTSKIQSAHKHCEPSIIHPRLGELCLWISLNRISAVLVAFSTIVVARSSFALERPFLYLPV